MTLFFIIIHYHKYFWALRQHFLYMHAKMCHNHINPVTPHLETFSPLLGSFLFPKHYPIYVHVFENISDSTYEREHVYLSF